MERESQAGFITQCEVLTKRSFINMFRDLGYYWLRFIIYIALCLCIGTIFYDIGHTYGSIQVSFRKLASFNCLCSKQFIFQTLHSVETSCSVIKVIFLNLQDRGAMLMFVAAFLTFMAIGGFPSFVEDMKVCT